jgi:hypothetical protein
MSAPARLPAVVRRAVAACVGVAALVAGACGGAGDRETATTPASRAVELLVGAGDSTYWVTSGPNGVRVRASPLFLARWDDRLVEVYVAGDERAFDDGAWFSAQRVYRRDLLTGDSALVFADPTVARLAARHAVRHPDARLLDDEEREAGPEEDENAPGASTSVALAAAHGPYLSLEQHTEVGGDATETGDGDTADGVLADVRRRRVVDLRTGHEVTLADLFGAEAAGVIEAAGRRALDSAVAALGPAARRALHDARQAAPAPDDRPAADAADDADATRRALRALRTLRLDPRNFGLAAHAGRPAVAFVALGHGDGAAVTLALPATPVPGPVPAWWRRDVSPALFVGPGADASAGPARWRDTSGQVELHARVADGAAALELAVAGREGDDRAVPVRPGGSRPVPGAHVARRTLPLARVPAPLQQVLRVDAGAAPPAVRRALRRAFEESAFYDDATTSVAWTPGRRDGRPPRSRRAAPCAPDRSVTGA